MTIVYDRDFTVKEFREETHDAIVTLGSFPRYLSVSHIDETTDHERFVILVNKVYKGYAHNMDDAIDKAKRYMARELMCDYKAGDVNG